MTIREIQFRSVNYTLVARVYKNFEHNKANKPLAKGYNQVMGAKSTCGFGGLFD